jgi:hypothetical protein
MLPSLPSYFHLFFLFSIEGAELFSILFFLFVLISPSLANPSELTFALQRYHALAGRKLLIVASGPQAYELAKKCKKIDPFLTFFIQPIPEYADTKREIKKSRTTYGAKCALHLSIKKRQWSLTPHGTCHDPTRTLSIKENGESWTLIDNKKREVRAIDYAVLTKDEDLLRVLKTEEKKTYNLGQRILLGSSIVAGAAIVPLIFGKSDELAQLEDRRWSAAFLLASGGILYEASKMPPRMKQGKNISNYRPKSMVLERLNETWPPPEEEMKDQENPEDERSPKINSTESPANIEETSQRPDSLEPGSTKPAPEESSTETTTTNGKESTLTPSSATPSTVPEKKEESTSSESEVNPSEEQP